MQFVIPKNKREQILREAVKVSKRTWTDQLDCSISWTRQPTDKTVEGVLALGLEHSHTHYTFILRDSMGGLRIPCFEIGLSTIGMRPEYFLWIELSIENGVALIKKFKLKERK